MAHHLANALQLLHIKPLWPQRLANRSPQWVIFNRQRRQLQHRPAPRLRTHRAYANVILVPRRHNQQNFPARLQTGIQIVRVPIPGFLAIDFAFGILAAPNRVINRTQPKPRTGRRRSNAARHQRPALHQRPLIRRLFLGVQVQHVPRHRPGAASQLPRKSLVVARQKRVFGRVIAQPVHREPGGNRLGFRMPRRYMHGQPINISSLQRIQVPGNLANVRRLSAPSRRYVPTQPRQVIIKRRQATLHQFLPHWPPRECELTCLQLARIKRR